MLTKDRRDSLLLIFMTLITIAFLLYVFLPSGKEKKKNAGAIESAEKPPLAEEIKQPPEKTPESTPEKTPEKVELREETVPTEASILEEYNNSITILLDKLWTEILATSPPFSAYNCQDLKILLLNSQNTVIEKLYKFSFFNLNDIAGLDFPPSYSNSLKFNLFVSLFLIKSQEELIEQTLASIPKIELEKLVNFNVYQLLDNEIEKDYQLIPVIFYLKHLLHPLKLYPASDITRFFREGADRLRDLTDHKYLLKIQELLVFSQRKENYRIEWVEEDGIFGNDKKIYKNLSLTVFTFLKQDYLIFPDTENSENNKWLKELAKSDSGDIELEVLNLGIEDPSRQVTIKKIIYTPISTQFVALLKEYSPPRGAEFLDALVRKRMEDFHKNYIILDFSLRESNPKAFKEELKKFGSYIKKNIPRD